MSALPHPEETVDSDPKVLEELEELAWAIEANLGEFSLILARCNSVSWQEQMMSSLKQICTINIFEIELEPETTKIYATIRESLHQAASQSQAPQVVTISGLDCVTHLDRLLAAANQIREEFRRFSLPMVWWVNDRVLKTLKRLAPDLESFSTTVEFSIATPQLIQCIEQTADEILAKLFEEGAGRFMGNSTSLNLNMGLSAKRRPELVSARQELQNRGVSLDLELQACLEFLLGPEPDSNMAQSLAHYEQNAALWAQTSKLECRGLSLYCLGLWWRSYAMLHRAYYEPACQLAEEYFKACIETFEQANREDLVAQFINAWGDILQRLGVWKQLAVVGDRAIGLHQRYSNPFRLARAYSFIAEVALASEDWQNAREVAQKAIDISVNTVPDARITTQEAWVKWFNQGSYLFVLARAEKGLGDFEKSLNYLETALCKTTHNLEPELYIQILGELQKNYFNKGQYKKAFDFKQEQSAIERSIGARAFIGAGRLCPELQLADPSNLTNLTANSGIVPQEIIASGRQQDVNRLIERIGRIDHKLTVIYGQSGVGKSSLIQAGLIPTLQKKTIGTRDVLPVLQQVYTDWIKELGQQLLQGKQEKFSSSDGFEVVLNHKGQNLSISINLISKILEQLKKNADSNLLTVIIFDQFEEFFFVFKERKQRSIFYDFLIQCLDIPYVKIILSLREDYLYYLLECNRVPDFNVINNNILDKKILYYLGNFLLSDARLVIESLTKQAQFVLESSLLAQLVKDLSKDLGEIRPIELQVVGAQLQTENIRTLQEYQERGPKEKLVERYLMQVIENCGSENERIAHLVLYLLTDDNNTRPIKTWTELAKESKSLADNPNPEAEVQKIHLVLDIFVKSGLVLLLPAQPADLYQLVHDYLVPVIRQKRWAEVFVELEQEREERRLAEQRLNWVLKRALIGSIVAGLVMAHLSILAWTAARKATRAWKQAQAQTQKVEIANERAIDSLSKYSLALSANDREFDALVEGLRLAKLLSRQQHQHSDRRNIKTQKQRVVAALQQAIYWVKEHNRLAGHNAEVNCVSFSPDGQVLVTASGDKTVKLWSPSGQLLQTLEGHQAAVTSISFSPHGKTIATTSRDGTIKLWNLDGTELLTLNGHQDEVTSISFSPDGKLLATGSLDSTIKLWQLKKGQAIEVSLLGTIRGHGDRVTSVSFSPDNRQIASASYDGTVKLWNLQGRNLQTLERHEGEVTSVSFSPDGNYIVTGSWDGTAKLWSRLGEELRTLQGHGGWVNSAIFSPDGQTIATASWDKTIKLWNLQGEELQTLVGHQDGIKSISFSPDGRLLASGSEVESVKLWRLPEESRKTFRAHKNVATSISFSPHISGGTCDRLFATASHDRTVKLWNTNGELVRTLWGHDDVVTSVSFSPDGQTLATASWDNTAQLWRCDGSAILPLEGHNSHVTSVSFSPDGQTIATASKDSTAKVWRLDGQLLQSLEGHNSHVTSVSFSPDGQTIATASKDATVKLWNLEGEERLTLRGHDSDVSDLSFSPDGQTLATASRDKTVKLWNLEGEERLTLRGHNATVTSVSFSPDGQTLATASRDRTVKLWNLAGQELRTFNRHQDWVTDVSFSADGETIVSSDYQGRVILWRDLNLSLDELLHHGCEWVGDYLKYNPTVDPSDRALCNNVGTELSNGLR